MENKYLEFTDEEIQNALAKMPSDQREAVIELADEDMLQYIPTLDEEAIPDCINELLVDIITRELEQHIRTAIMSCTVCLNQYFVPFKQYRKLILEEKAGGSNEESC